jgi:hypothetical protein
VRAARIPVLAATIALMLAACGSSSSGLTDSQLRTRATRICGLAARRTDRIATPAEPRQGAAFINHGIAALAPELAALRRLGAPSDMAGDYRDALDATSAELTALRSTVKGLKAGNDPVVAIKTLEQQLKPAEAKASLAWATLDLPACQDD